MSLAVGRVAGGDLLGGEPDRVIQSGSSIACYSKRTVGSECVPSLAVQNHLLWRFGREMIIKLTTLDRNRNSTRAVARKGRGQIVGHRMTLRLRHLFGAVVVCSGTNNGAEQTGVPRSNIRCLRHDPRGLAWSGSKRWGGDRKAEGRGGGNKRAWTSILFCGWTRRTDVRCGTLTRG